MKTHNPFLQLNIKMSPKALFESLSFEAEQTSYKERLETIVKIIHARFNLHEVVHDYLEAREATDHDLRSAAVLATINNYTHSLLLENLENRSKSKRLISLYQKVYIDQIEAESLNEGIDSLTQTVDCISTVRHLLLAYFNNPLRYKSIRNYLGIDLEQEISKKLIAVDSKMDKPEWSYLALYRFFKDKLLIALERNELICLDESHEVSRKQIINALIKRYFPVEDRLNLSRDEDFRRERLYDFAVKVVNTLWLDQALFEEPIYLVNTKYSGLASHEMPNLYQNNIISICIKSNESKHISHYQDLLKGEDPNYNKDLVYIHRFVDLVNLVKEQDVIVVASYLNFDPKIGLIKRGSEVFKREGEDYTLFCLQLKSVYCTPELGQRYDSFKPDNYQDIKRALPTNLDVTPFLRFRAPIYKLYYGWPNG